MKKAKEILDSGLNNDGIIEELEELANHKLVALGLASVETTELSHPELTAVEKNLLVIMEVERFFEDSGDILGYVDRFENCLNCWEEAGLDNSASVLKYTVDIDRLYRMIREGVPENTIRDPMIELIERSTYEMQCSLMDSTSEKLISYVRDNVDQFCSQDESGSFI